MSQGTGARWTGPMNVRPTISDLGLSAGKKARLFRILYQHGLCNGTAAGATGLIFGRNVWQRGHEESLKFAGKLQEILVKYPCQSIESFASRHRSFGERMFLPS